jgi:uncharacterized protein YodC (DUF2158 family)
MFKVGEVVVLKSGGPDMTVERDAGHGDIWCSWFVNGEYMRQVFKVPMLKHKVSTREE